MLLFAGFGLCCLLLFAGFGLCGLLLFAGFGLCCLLLFAGFGLCGLLLFAGFGLCGLLLFAVFGLCGFLLFAVFGLCSFFVIRRIGCFLEIVVELFLVFLVEAGICNFLDGIFDSVFDGFRLGDGFAKSLCELFCGGGLFLLFRRFRSLFSFCGFFWSLFFGRFFFGFRFFLLLLHLHEWIFVEFFEGLQKGQAVGFHLFGFLQRGEDGIFLGFERDRRAGLADENLILKLEAPGFRCVDVVDCRLEVHGAEHGELHAFKHAELVDALSFEAVCKPIELGEVHGIDLSGFCEVVEWLGNFGGYFVLTTEFAKFFFGGGDGLLHFLQRGVELLGGGNPVRICFGDGLFGFLQFLLALGEFLLFFFEWGFA